MGRIVSCRVSVLMGWALNIIEVSFTWECSYVSSGTDCVFCIVGGGNLRTAENLHSKFPFSRPEENLLPSGASILWFKQRTA